MLANSHSCDSLLHWAVAWAMMSSDWQCEQTGVDRVAGDDLRRLTIGAGSWVELCVELNGLRSKACVMLFPVEVGLDAALVTA